MAAYKRKWCVDYAVRFADGSIDTDSHTFDIEAADILTAAALATCKAAREMVKENSQEVSDIGVCGINMVDYEDDGSSCFDGWEPDK